MSCMSSVRRLLVCSAEKSDQPTHRINGFSDFVHRLDSKELEDKNATFQTLDLFPSSSEGRPSD
jgi:hypothetical protein